MDSMEMDYVDELRHLLTLAKNPKTINYLQKGIESETSGSNVAQNGTAPQPIKVTMECPRVTGERPTPVMVKISNYGWDQSSKFVKIYISDLPGLNEVTEDSVRTKFGVKLMEVEIQNLKGKSYSLVINDLLKPIIPDQSLAKVKNGMVIVSLKKSSTNSWDCLTGREKKIRDSREMKPPDVPDKDEDPGAGIMKLMQKMYDEGDDEMKRTIKKAWHESQEKKMKTGDIGE